MLTLTISDIKPLFKILLDNPKSKEKVYYLEGPSGIGKTEVVKQLGDELGYETIIVSLGQLVIEDMQGLPYIKNEITHYARPKFFPSEFDTNKKYLFFLDELNHADENMMSVLYELFTDKKVTNHQLPKNTVIITAGNRVADGGIANEFPAPVRNRIIKYTVIADVEGWLKHAEEKRIHPSILAYIQHKHKTNTNVLHSYEKDNEDFSFATPRSWFALSDQLIALKDNKKYIPATIFGVIGQTIGQDFNSFLELLSKIDLDSILNKKSNEKINDPLTLLTIYYYFKEYSRNIELTLDNIINVSHFINLNDENNSITMMFVGTLKKHINEKHDNSTELIDKLFEDKNSLIDKKIWKKYNELNETLNKKE
jgi:inhibitor of KinA sporulation pathway (predicted exonuclease)